MEIKTRKVDGILVVDLEGRLDHQASGDAKDQLIKIINEGNNMILLNFKGLEYISSAGLSVILLAGKHVKSSLGKMKVCEAKGVVKEVMEISGFNNLMQMFESEKDGIVSFAN